MSTDLMCAFLALAVSSFSDIYGSVFITNDALHCDFTDNLSSVLQTNINKGCMVCTM
jgi:hypothetical protein